MDDQKVIVLYDGQIKIFAIPTVVKRVMRLCKRLKLKSFKYFQEELFVQSAESVDVYRIT